MDNIKIEQDGNVKSIDLNINNLNIDDSREQITFSKTDDNDNDNYNSIDNINFSNDSKPNLSSFDKKDIHFGLDLLENPNKKKKITSDGDITFSPKSSDVILENSSININNESEIISDIKEFKISDDEPKITIKDDTNSFNLNNKNEDIVEIDSDVNIDDIFKDVSKQDTEIKSISIDNLNLEDPPTVKDNTSDIIHNVPTPDTFIPRRKTPEEILLEKKDYLFKFDRLLEKGYNIQRRFTLASDLDEMAYEYNKIKNSKEMDNSIKFQRQMLMACITGVEWMNNKFDPFDVKLEGWSESVNENINDYDEVFEELHEKYKDKASVPPEIKLLFMLGGSAFMFHLSKTLFKTSLPGMEQIMQQNPELMKQFASAAMNSMSNQNPGFANFMGNMGGIPQMPQQQMPQQQMPQQQMHQQQMHQQQMHQQQMPQQMYQQQMPQSSERMTSQSTEEMYKNQTNMFNSRKEMSGPSGVDDILNKLSKNEIRNVDNLQDTNNSDGIKGTDLGSSQINSGISINI